MDDGDLQGVARLTPAELDTQVPPGLLPDVPAPDALKQVVAAIHACPPSIEPKLQLKKNFRSLLQQPRPEGLDYS